MDPGLSGYQGKTPAVGLVDPKFPHNVGAAVRAASCYGVGQVWFSGDRVRLDASRRYRLPREERMLSLSATRPKRIVPGAHKDNRCVHVCHEARIFRPCGTHGQIRRARRLAPKS
jgi:hypothetical protein